MRWKNWPYSYLATIVGLAFLATFATACSQSTTGDSGDQGMDAEMEHDEREHDDNADVVRVPNNGASIHLVSPADGASFQAGDEIVVEIETENITVGEEGNHWHIYIDGSSWGMVMGHNTDQVLRNLEPGHHEISVYLSIDTHEELEDGDSVTIEVEG